MSASEERKVKVVLSAVVSEYVEKMSAAQAATAKVRDEAAKQAKEARDADKAAAKAAAEAAAKTEEGWKAVAKATSIAGGAVLSVGGAMVAAGVSYNSMQQQTRAALKTLLGSAKEANDQMDALDEFAKTSPFAKTTFIKAQQQMIAFGIETKKVIPYLKAVGDATAASGGSNQQLGEVAEIMSKISASSKITAEDLNQFGERGINAAELIGLSMGKTGAEIRTEITRGTLDADEALDALVSGMNTKFEGASANVKTTFSGAMDRVTAAWRDLGSTLAEPLVSKNGGGMLVDALNLAADLTRAFINLPAPIRDATVALVGITAAVAAARGAFFLAGPKIDSFKNALSTAGITGGGFKGTMSGIVGLLGGPWGLALAAAGAGLTVLMDAIKGSSGPVDDIASKLKKLDTLGAIKIAADNGSEGLRAFTGRTLELGAALDELKSIADEKAIFGDVSFAGLRALDLQDTTNDIKSLGEGFASLASESMPQAVTAFQELSSTQNLSGEQMSRFIEMSPALVEVLNRQASELGMTADANSRLEIMTGNVSDATAVSAEHIAEVTGAAEDATGAIDELANSIKKFGSAELDAREANIKFEEATASLTEKVEKNGWTLDVATKAGRENSRAIDDLIRATLDSASATYTQTGNQEAANNVLAEGRRRLEAQRDAFIRAGGSAQDFDRYVRSIPSEVGTLMKAKTNTREAESSLNYAARDRTVRINAVPGSRNIPLLFADGGAVHAGLPRFDSGGSVRGPGTGTSDSIRARLSNGEHVLTAKDVLAMGGQQAVYSFRAGLHQYGRQSIGSMTAAPAATSSGGVSITGGNFGYDPETIAREIAREQKIQERLARI